MFTGIISRKKLNWENLMSNRTTLTLLVILLLLLALPLAAVNAQSEQYMRFQNNGTTTFTCETNQFGVVFNSPNGVFEFNNLPADAEYTVSFYINGALSSSGGPHPVPATSGILFPVHTVVSWASYPLNVEVRLITLINGSPIYQSSMITSCNADVLTPQPVTIINLNLTLPLPAACLIPLPADAVQGRLLSNVSALFSPNPTDTTNVVLPAGSAWFVIDAKDGYYKLWIACQADALWVPADAIGPNYEPPWNGASLPAANEPEISE